MYCKYCNREFNRASSITVHEYTCKLNPDKKSYPRSPNQGFPKGYKPWNTGTKGLTTPGTKGKPGTMLGKKHSDATRKQMSESRKKLYESGWESTAGRCKKLTYVSDIAGEVKIDGTWELEFCKYADKHKLNWVRNKQRFSYIKPDGKQASYLPDFYVKDIDSYVEVKGYETDLDRAKWLHFPHKLVILRKEDIGIMAESGLLQVFAKHSEA